MKDKRAYWRKRNNSISDFLGVNIAAARNRLVRGILFKLLCKYGENVCFRCGLSIQSIDELSLDHIKSWWLVDPQLYFDPSNVAFSHRKCNTPDRPYRGKQRGLQAGLKYCTGCEATLFISNFDIDMSKKDKHFTYCKTCKSNTNKKRRR